MARPTKFTPQTIERLLKSLRLGATHKIACEAAGISDGIFYRWMRQGNEANGNPEKVKFVKLVKAATASHAEQCLAVILKAATQEKRWQAAAWLLERRHEGFSRYEEVRISHSEERLDMSPDELHEHLIKHLKEEPEDSYEVH
jgi:transposase-like protein